MGKRFLADTQSYGLYATGPKRPQEVSLRLNGKLEMTTIIFMNKAQKVIVPVYQIVQTIIIVIVIVTINIMLSSSLLS